jgi:hypothetical protein
MRVLLEGQAMPPCPSEYPHALDPLYASFFDDRGCSNCDCSGVSGGSCSGTLAITNDPACDNTNAVPYALGSGCKAFSLGSGVQPTHVSAQYTLLPGACSVASAASPIGNAAPSGNVTALCCQ